MKPKNAGVIRDKQGKFIKGTSGNPAGKPEGTISITAKIKQELKKCPEGQDKRTYLDLLVKRILRQAISEGNEQMIKHIWNYIDGFPKQSLEHSGGVEIKRIEVEFRENK